MTNGFDERGKNLEDEYFHRKNQEAIEKLREKMAVSKQAKATGVSSMRCPRCDGDLKEHKVDYVELNACKKCGGVWLDSAALEQLTKKEADGWFGRLWKQYAEKKD